MSGRSNPSAHRAFTLLEMIIALMITSMIVLTLFRFVSAHLATIRFSTEIREERDTLDAAVRYLQAQMNTLPAIDDSTLSGQPFKFHGLESDEISWVCPAGPGVLTTAAPGNFKVTLAVQPVDERSTETELGLRRQPAPGNKASLDLNRGGAGGRYDWLPLIRPMAALEIRYFDPADNSWKDTWKDAARRPPLLRLRLWKHADDAPLEAMIRVPSAQIAR
ncbi:MAG: prepilin-type N-terminal cleavage/methylation domain-containing protein [Chthoniobacter sp.]|nr:prepilin-type N-terminal cleavage/methylation domain-containing protein [Chthoniobacter sp.]